MAREPMITARITKNKALLMRVVMSSGCGLGASMAELDANLARRLPAAGGMLESPAAGIGPSQLDALGFVGLRIRLKLADKAFNDLRNLRPHKAEVKYPIRLKFHRVFTHKAEVSPNCAKSAAE